MRIVFCGVGALGSLAAALSRNLDATLVFIDFDRVESKNLLSQAFVKQSVGRNKAEALKLQLLNFNGIKAEAFGVRLSEDNCQALLDKADLVVDCFDNAKSRQLVSEFCRGHDKPLLHAAISADGSFGVVRWDELFTADAEDEEGQATCEGGEHLPLIAQVSATVARTIQDFCKSGTRRSSMISLNGVQET
jgi:hypothetical protein